MTSFVNLGEGFVLPLDAISFVAPDQDDNDIVVVTFTNGDEVNLDKAMFARLLDAMCIKFTVLDHSAVK